ncbi:MAG: type II secretion system protein [Candidatus Jacksonbacteria bacterium]
MNYFFYKKRGFTLIELLIVIAILGLLVTIIILSTSNTRTIAKDSAIKATLGSLRSGGELWVNTNETYAGFCVDDDCNCVFCSTDWKNICSAVKIQNSGKAVNCTFLADNAGWCASSQFAGSSSYYCVDSTNKAQTQAAACSAGACQ